MQKNAVLEFLPSPYLLAMRFARLHCDMIFAVPTSVDSASLNEGLRILDIKTAEIPQIKVEQQAPLPNPKAWYRSFEKRNNR